MRILFVDESGTAPNPNSKTKYFVLEGVIIPENAWATVRDWLNAIREEYSITGEIKWRYFSPHNKDEENLVAHLSKDDKSLNPLAKKHLHCARMLLRSAWHANGFYGRSGSAKGRFTVRELSESFLCADADVSDRPEISGAGSNSVLWLIELFRRVPCLQSL